MYLVADHDPERRRSEQAIFLNVPPCPRQERVACGG
jgi:hypothetical protein